MADIETPLQVIIIHGAHGGPETNWFPWLHAALAGDGIKVVRPRFPTPEGQSLSAWFEAYYLAVKSLHTSPAILVGHSLGAAFALRLIERAVEPVAGVFLAAGFVGALGLPDYDLSINHFSTSHSIGRRSVRERGEYSDRPSRCRAGAKSTCFEVVTAKLRNHFSNINLSNRLI